MRIFPSISSGAPAASWRGGAGSHAHLSRTGSPSLLPLLLSLSSCIHYSLLVEVLVSIFPQGRVPYGQCLWTATTSEDCGEIQGVISGHVVWQPRIINWGPWILWAASCLLVCSYICHIGCTHYVSHYIIGYINSLQVASTCQYIP